MGLRERTHVKVDVAQIPVLVEGKPMKTCTMQGNLRNIFDAIDGAVDLLEELVSKNTGWDYEPPSFLLEEGYGNAETNPFMNLTDSFNTYGSAVTEEEEYIPDA